MDYIAVACTKNEVGKNSARLGAFWKRMGTMKGFSDLMVFKLKTREIVFVEMKNWEDGVQKESVDRTKQKPEQEYFEFFITNTMGMKYFLIDSYKAQNELIEYLKG